jgi:hypothetical protein
MQKSHKRKIIKDSRHRQNKVVKDRTSERQAERQQRREQQQQPQQQREGRPRHHRIYHFCKDNNYPNSCNKRFKCRWRNGKCTCTNQFGYWPEVFCSHTCFIKCLDQYPFETSDEPTSEWEPEAMTQAETTIWRTTSRLGHLRQSIMNNEAKQERDDQQTAIFNNKQRQARYQKRTRRRAERWADIHLRHEQTWQQARSTPKQQWKIEDERRANNAQVRENNASIRRNDVRIRALYAEADAAYALRNHQQQQQQQQEHIESQLTPAQYNEYLANRGDNDEKKQERDKQNNKRQKRAQERKG